MTTVSYKGFHIIARPYLLFQTRRWTADLEIHGSGRRKPFSPVESYRTERAADARCVWLGHRIIDGRIPGWSVEALRTNWRFWTFIHTCRRVLMRPLLIAGIVLLGLGAWVLLQGASFMTRRNVLEVGDLKVSASERQSVPPWAGGVAVVAGLALIAAGARRKA